VSDAPRPVQDRVHVRPLLVDPVVTHLVAQPSRSCMSSTIAVMLKLAEHAASSSGPAWAALFIALVGLVLSSAALGWQILAFVKSGSRVRVELKFGIFLSQNSVGLLTPQVAQLMEDSDAASSEQPVYLPSQLVTALGPQSLSFLWLVAEISNVGRLAVTIQGCQWQTVRGGAIEQRPVSAGESFPRRLDANDQCIAAIDCNTIIAFLDAPFGGTMTSGREVWPVIRLGNRRTVKGKRIRVPVTSDPSQHVLVSDENPGPPFRLAVESVSHVLARDDALVKGYIERGTVRIGDKLEVLSSHESGQRKPRGGECIGVGNLNAPNQASTQQKLVGVLVSGLKEKDVRPGDVLQTTADDGVST